MCAQNKKKLSVPICTFFMNMYNFITNLIYSKSLYIKFVEYHAIDQTFCNLISLIFTIRMQITMLKKNVKILKMIQ